MARFPNPPLARIHPRDLMTRHQVEVHFDISPSALKQWVRRGIVEPLDIPGGIQLFHGPTIADAEHDTWQHGGNHTLRGGRPANYKPCQAA